MACDPMDERYEDPDYEALGIDWLDVLSYPDCPVCGGESILLGSLGRREHYSCRDCGMQHSHVPALDTTEVQL